MLRRLEARNLSSCKFDMKNTVLSEPCPSLSEIQTRYPVQIRRRSLEMVLINSRINLSQFSDEFSRPILRTNDVH